MKKIDSPAEFWEAYQALQWKFMEDNKAAIVSHLEESKAYVNGLTDGWYMLKQRIFDMRKMWPSQFEGEAKNLADALNLALERWLK